jgi:hypothetical protein
METLTGQLKWERTVDGICIDYRTTNDPAAVRSAIREALTTSLWTLGLLTFVVFLMDGIAPFRRHGHFWMLPLCVSLGLLLGSALNIYFVDRKLRMSSRLLEIEVRDRPFNSKQYSYDIKIMYNLRFASRDTDSEPMNRDRKGELRFDLGGRSDYCFVGITQLEAEALIAKMMEVYAFPKYPLEDGKQDPTATGV